MRRCLSKLFSVRRRLFCDLRVRYSLCKEGAFGISWFLRKGFIVFKENEFCIKGYNFFGEDGLSGFDKNASKETVKAIQDWFVSLPEAERTLAMGIDYTVVGSVDDAKKALEEARENMRIAAAKEEAGKAGVEDATFDAYTEILMDNNEALKENKALAAEVAAANAKLNKGIEEL